MASSIREVVGVFDSVEALEKTVYDLETHGFDRAAFSVLGNETAVERKLGHRYSRIQEMEDEPRAPRETFFSHISRLEADYLPAPVLASMGVLAVAGAGGALAMLVAAGTGAALGAALSRIFHMHNAERIAEQLERGGLLLWVNVHSDHEEQIAKQALGVNAAHDIHVHEITPPLS
jgi:transposase